VKTSPPAPAEQTVPPPAVAAPDARAPIVILRAAPARPRETEPPKPQAPPAAASAAPPPAASAPEPYATASVGETAAAPAEPSGIAVVRGPLKSSRTAHARVSNPVPARASAAAPAGERQKIAIVRGGPYLPGMARAGRLPFGPRIIHLGAEAR